MGRSISRKRPWLAALLAALATGLGHVYLRRGRRALGWLAVLFGTAFVFVDPAAVEAVASGGGVDLSAMAPVLIVGSLSVVDAYALAHAQNSLARTTGRGDGESPPCPNCGRELDPDIEFCHWCTADISAAPDERDERERA